jgi:hypothetical protein
MVLGHVALAFAAKRVTPRVSLGVLLAAAQLADVVWPILVAAGIEQVRIVPGITAVTPLDFVSYPYSHSLAALVVWGVMMGSLYRGIAGGRRTFWVLAVLVVSHWILDYVTHRPDMPLYPGGPRFGLGLWNSVPATLLAEAVMYTAGLSIYLRSTRARDNIGRWAFVAFAIVWVVVYLASLVGPPPPSIRALWSTAVLGAALVLWWAWWADRHRDVAS